MNFDSSQTYNPETSILKKNIYFTNQEMLTLSDEVR